MPVDRVPSDVLDELREMHRDRRFVDVVDRCADYVEAPHELRALLIDVAQKASAPRSGPARGSHHNDSAWEARVDLAMETERLRDALPKRQLRGERLKSHRAAMRRKYSPPLAASVIDYVIEQRYPKVMREAKRRLREERLQSNNEI